MSDTIYRYRPCDRSSISNTITEIKQPYLWFSRPECFNDSEDANIFSFTENNESIQDSFKRIYESFTTPIEDSKMIGICCFTKSLPSKNKWRRFPKGGDGIIIEYDKKMLDEFFLDTFNLYEPFKPVEYHEQPTLFRSYSKYDILWRSDENSEYFKSLRNIELDPKLLDELFVKMFTRINQRFSEQNESRIILAGRNIPTCEENVKGYKVSIPKDSIKCIYATNRTNKFALDTIRNSKIPIHIL